ncbi:MAG: hypothetical protein K6V97_12140 [Actinomycetia bacterium]|nr:hypothetical protein [Actinomycetes bacterium]
MVEVRTIVERGDAWEIELAIREGVYRLDRYPVRVEEVPAPPAGWDEAAQKRQIAAFVVDRVARHMRRGSLPPRGTRLDGSAVWTWKGPEG